eukprot:gene27860-33643_t
MTYVSVGLKGLGALVVVNGMWKSASWVNLNMMNTASMGDYGANDGAYAVVTGASDGIGKALAYEGAKRGFNLVLISRSQDKLEAVAQEIKRKHSVEVVVIACDCSNSIQNNVASIKKQCADLPVRVLWNNVGVNTGEAAALEEKLLPDLECIVNTNCLFTISLTSALIPIMKKQVTGGKSKAVIANVSSFLSVLPAANYVPYSASKAFVNQFSSALHCELEDSGIYVSNVRPAHVATAMSGIREASLMVPSPDTWAIYAWNKLGIAPCISPYLPHAVQELVPGLLPDWLLRRAVRMSLAK